MSVMNKRVAEILLTSVAPHRGFAFKVSEGEGGYIALTVFLDEFAEFSEQQRQDLAMWIGNVCQKIRDIGVPCYIEGAESRTRKGKYAV